MAESVASRCPMCRSVVRIAERFNHGDQLGCDTCGAFLKVGRRGGVRLVVADVGPVRDDLRQTQQRMFAVQADLRKAKASFGIGANGLGIGLLYVISRLALEEADLTHALIWEAVGLALATGILLEVANYLFLAKRQAISQLTAELAEHQDHVRHLQQILREAAKF